MDSKGHGQVIKALVPMAEILKYAPDLRSMTSGRGSFEAHFSIITTKRRRRSPRRSSRTPRWRRGAPRPRTHN